MIYDTIPDLELVTVGSQQQFGTEKRWISPVYYNGEDLEYTIKNRYVNINGFEKNEYDKEYIVIKSKHFGDLVTTLAEKLGATLPLSSDGTFRAQINTKTTIKSLNESTTGNLEETVRKRKFSALLVLATPSIYKDATSRTPKTTIQIHVRQLIVKEVYDENELEIEVEKLTLST
jgi:hypothetical protein